MAQIPKIFFESGWLIDLGWDFRNPEKPMADQALPHIKKLCPRLDKLWNERGGVLLETTSKVLDKPWKRQELTCSLVVCPDQPSNSHPLMLNVFRMFKSFEIEQLSPEQERRFTETLFHELLHRMLDDYWSENLESGVNPTPLIQKYKGEDIFVHAHLHLFALQEKVYRELDMIAAWEEAKMWIQEILNKSYPRAADIVAQEGFETFVSELK